MKTIAKYIAVLIAGIIVGLLFSAVTTDSKLGGVYNQTLDYFYGGLNVGPTGSDVTNIIEGTMNCTGAATVAAANVGNYDCSVTGVVSGDKVFATLTTQPKGIFIAGAVASTTAGYVQLVLGNASTTALAPTGATTTVQYLIVR